MTVRYLSPQLHSSRSVKRDRVAFTLIEMLVVIGILLILGAITVLALGKLDNGTKATKVVLASCQSMLSEYESSGGDLRLLTGYTSNPGNVNPASRAGAVNVMKGVFDPLLRVAANKTAMTRVPSKQQISTGDSNYPFNLPADAWKNPVVYINSPGLTNITVGGVTLTPNDPDPKRRYVRSADGRPFFASAGPDGDFTTGDDNVYSFEN